MLKFSSSAGHVAGRPLISSESFTWLREHFKTALSQTKPEAEELLLNGVNHMFLHGSTYSPERAGWPGKYHLGRCSWIIFLLNQCAIDVARRQSR